MLVQMERQIDREIAADNKANGVAFGTQTDNTQMTSTGTEDEDFDSDSDEEEDDNGPMLMYGPQPQIVTNDLKSLDEMVSSAFQFICGPSERFSFLCSRKASVVKDLFMSRKFLIKFLLCFETSCNMWCREGERTKHSKFLNCWNFTSNAIISPHEREIKRMHMLNINLFVFVFVSYLMHAADAAAVSSFSMSESFPFICCTTKEAQRLCLESSNGVGEINNTELSFASQLSLICWWSNLFSRNVYNWDSNFIIFLLDLLFFFGRL